MTVESDYSQSGTRLNGKFGIELQVNGKSTKWRETMMGISALKLRALLSLQNGPRVQTGLPPLAGRPSPFEQSQRDLTASKKDLERQL